MKKRALSFLLALVMVLSMVPFGMLSALQVNAGTTDPVTLTVTPSSIHAELNSEGKYEITAALSLTTTEAFNLGSLEFSMTPGVDVSFDNANAAIAVEMTAVTTTVTDATTGEESQVETGEMKFTHIYDENNVVALAADTAYALGTVTLTSEAPFGYSAVTPTIVGVYDSPNNEGTAYAMNCVMVGAYENGGHNDNVTWTAVDQTYAATWTHETVADGGHYYLTEDVTLTKDAFAADVDSFADKTFTICLNGHTLNGGGESRIFRLQSGVNVTVCDCRKQGTLCNTKTVDGAEVAYNGANGAIAGLVEAASASYLTLQDITVDGKDQISGGKNGGAFYVADNANSTLTIENCTIKDFAAKQGAAVNVGKGKLHMTGSVVTDNSGVAVGTDDWNGNAAILIMNSGDSYIKNSQITGNTNDGKGASALHVSDGSTVRLEDVEITGNTRTGSTYYGAVQLGGNSSDLTFAGQVKICGNTDPDGAERNVVLNMANRGDKSRILVDELEDGTCFSITVRSVASTTAHTRDNASDLLEIAEGATQSDWSAAWVSYDEKPEYDIVKNADGTFSFEIHSHDDMPGVVWEKWGDTEAEQNSLPTQSGHYYLVHDIKSPGYSLTTTKDITICLNGYTVKGRMYTLTNVKANANVVNHELTVCDCSSEADRGTLVPAANGLLTGTLAAVAGGSTVDITLKNVVIDGTGVTVSSNGVLNGGHSSAHYYLTDCVIKNITSSKYDSTNKYSQGAVYLSSGADMDATRVRFENNKTTNAASTGGAIMMRTSSPTVNLTDCVFTGNQAAQGGAIYQQTGALTMTGTVFEENKAVTTSTSNYSGGGAIYAIAGTVKATDCDFTANTSTTSGAAVYSYGTSGSTAGAALTLKDCRITDNTNTRGGAVYIGNKTHTIEDCVFTGNSCKVENGSALYLESASTVYLKDSLIYNNTSTVAEAAGVYVGGTTTSLILSGCVKVYSNLANGVERNVQFGKAYTDGGKNVLHVNELAEGSRVSVYTLDDTRATADQLVAVNGTQTNWNSSWVKYDNASKYVEKGDDTATTDVTETFYFGSDASHGDFHDSAETWTAVDSIDDFDKTADGHYYLTKDLTITKSIEFGNYKTDDSQAGKNIVLCLNGHSIHGSSVRVFRLSSGCKLTVCDCTAHTRADGAYVAGKMTSSVKTTEGGIVAIYHTDYALTGTTFTMEDGIMDGSGKVSTKRGAAILVAGGSSSLNAVVNINGGEIRNFNSSDTTTAKQGNAIYLGEYSKLNIRNAKIYNNTGYEGGAIFVNTTGTSGNTTEATIENTYLANNTATNGGAIYFYNNSNYGHKITLTNCDLAGNTAKDGGAIYIRGAGAKNETEITNCRFANNTATTQGGAVSLRNSVSTLKITDSTFTGNTAPNGGAIRIPVNAPTTIKNCEFIGNKATTSMGGAIVITTPATNCTIQDSIFTSNSAKTTGGAIYFYGKPTVTVSGCTMTENTAAEGSAMYLSAETKLTVTDSTIQNNVATTETSALTLSDSTSTLTITGKTVISGNKLKNGTVCNVKLPSGETFNATSLTNGASISITAVDFTENAAAPVQVATIDNSVKDGMLVLDNPYDGKARIVLDGTAANAVYYSTAEDALTNAGTSGAAQEVVKLDGNVGTVTLPETTTDEQFVQLDLNGKTFEALGSAGTNTTLHLGCSTMAYTDTDPLTVLDSQLTNVTIPSAYKLGNRRYVVTRNDANNGYEIHRVQLAVSAKALRPADMSVGVKVRFSKAISLEDFTFGMKFVVNDGMNDVVTEKLLNTTLVNGRDLTVIIDNFDLANHPEYAEYTIYGTPYIVLAGTEEKVYGSPVELSFKAMVQYADTSYNSLTKAQKDAIDAMCATVAFKGTNYQNWGLQNIAQ